MTDATAFGPYENVINVAWVGGIYVLLNFFANDNEDITLTTVAPDTVEFRYRKMKTPPDPGGDTGGMQHFAWHIPSPAYVTTIVGVDTWAPVLTGYTGASSLDMALTGKNIHGVNQNDLWFLCVSEQAANEMVAALNLEDAQHWNFYMNHLPGSSGFLRHLYQYGSKTFEGEPTPPPKPQTRHIFLVRVSSLLDVPKTIASFKTKHDNSLVINVYPTSNHVVYPGDKSGPDGEPFYPIRHKDNLGSPPNTQLWIMNEANQDSEPPETPGLLAVNGSATLMAKRDEYQILGEKQIVQVWSSNFHYTVQQYRVDDKPQVGPPQWKNIIGVPPLL